MSDKSCCSGRDCSCGENQLRRIDIDFLFLDLSICERCQGTEAAVEEAVSDIYPVLLATGVELVLNKIHVTTEEQANEVGLVTSPTIRVAGKDIQLEVKENLCESCGDLCGEDVDCRVWVYQGKEYNVPPKGMIIEAILKEVYGGTLTEEPPSRDTEEIPENLKKYFVAKGKKDCCC